MPSERYLHCSNCGVDRVVEAPVCSDGHGCECPERACTECGTALFLDPSITGERPHRATRRAA